MMRKIILTTCLFFFSIGIFSQTDLETKKNAIIFSPLNILDFFNPSVQVGYQRQFNEKWEVQFEIGIILKKGLLGAIRYREEDGEEDGDSSITEHKGGRLRLELKNYLYKYKSSRHYLSFELFYLKNNTRTTESFYSNDNVDSEYQDLFLKKKQKYGLNIKYGVKFLMFKNFFFELHAGIGVSYRRIRHENRENLDDNYYFNTFSKRMNSHIAIGDKWVFNFPLNGKIGYRF